MKNSNSRIILGGAIIGAITGLVAAMIISRRAERNKREIVVTTGEGIQLGVMIFGLLRAIASLSDD